MAAKENAERNVGVLPVRAGRGELRVESKSMCVYGGARVKNVESRYIPSWVTRSLLAVCTYMLL